MIFIVIKVCVCVGWCGQCFSLSPSSLHAQVIEILPGRFCGYEKIDETAEVECMKG